MSDRPRRPFFLRMLPKLLASLAVGGAVAALASRSGLPLVPDAAAFRHLAWWALPAYVVMTGATHAVRAARWRHLVSPIKPLGMREVLALNFIGFFAIFALPFRLGEAARPAMSKLRHGIPVSVGVGTVAVERVIDGLVTSACVFASLFVLPSLETQDPVTRHLPVYGKLALTLFGGLMFALVLFLWQRDFATRLVQRTVGLVSPSFADFVASKVASLAEGLATLRSPRLTAAFVFETLVYWFLNAVGMWLLAVGCDVPISLAQAIAIMGVLAIGILLPAGPGMFGSFQLAVCAGLRLYVPEAIVPVQGALFIFLLYVVQSVVITVAGLVPLASFGLRVEDVLETGEPASVPENLP